MLNRRYNEDLIVFSFINDSYSETSRLRYVETQSLHVMQGYVVQIEIVIGCLEGHLSSSDYDAELEIQYSTNHGKSWGQIFQV